MSSSTFIIEGEVNVSITITEVNGTLQFDVTVLDETGSIGDLNALFFDLADDSLTSGIQILGDDVTGTALKVDGVTKIDSYTNMNGEVINDYGKFDGGVQFGTAGIGTDDIRSTTFTMSHDSQDLSLSDFSLQDFGIRLTSVGTEDDSRTDSLKLGGTAPEFDNTPATSPNDDSFTFTSYEIDNPPGLPDVDADGFDFNVLTNDTVNGTAYTGQVTSVNGSTDLVGQVVAGSDGGTIVIYPDGTIDFSALNDDGSSPFDALGEDETATTSFTYGIDGSDQTLTITVVGLGDTGGPIGI